MRCDYQAAIFDLDGVIADTAHLHFQAWKQLANELEMDIEDSLEEQLKGIDRMASLNLVLGARVHEFNDEQKMEFATRKNEYYLQEIRQLTSDDLLPGVRTLLASLVAAGIPVGLASASKNAKVVLSGLGISALFDYIADANLIANPKPHPEIFLTAARGLGVTAEHCLAFEDAIAGVEAIKRAGMAAIGVGCPRELNDADDVYNDLEEFPMQRYFQLSLAA
ncbi:beta-phosphoglucomutase [Pseudomaricurvus alkylphenolicus]|jgi:beta-phosphoglucomutase|uniref:beta-phosphoglucomutase n=1 Tax=Pseudomaricurvus alkylphenolicus TaxID=1306991 RepID=UPI00141EDAC5|nr:beta-phosphoglucomutase [Pseudomaricurvus alkylphenolicus]NIB40890.1 beta-phosphoglucomutase [Pseudomaricurvus alkylphenolicus]